MGLSGCLKRTSDCLSIAANNHPCQSEWRKGTRAASSSEETTNVYTLCAQRFIPIHSHLPEIKRREKKMSWKLNPFWHLDIGPTVCVWRSVLYLCVLQHNLFQKCSSCFFSIRLHLPVAIYWRDIIIRSGIMQLFPWIALQKVSFKCLISRLGKKLLDGRIKRSISRCD